MIDNLHDLKLKIIKEKIRISPEILRNVMDGTVENKSQFILRFIEHKQAPFKRQ